MRPQPTNSTSTYHASSWWRQGSRAVPAAIAVSLTGVAIALSLARALGGFDHNENMYVAAGWFVSQWVPLYSGIPFGQTPYLPLVYAAAFAISGTTHYLLTAKLLTWLGAMGAAAMVWRVVYRRTDARAGALAAALFVANPFTLRVVSESSNYVLPITCTVAAIAEAASLCWFDAAATADEVAVICWADKATDCAPIAIDFMLPCNLSSKRFNAEVVCPISSCFFSSRSERISSRACR
jgi:hypothetical protein